MKIAYLYPETLPSRKARAVSVVNSVNSMSKYYNVTLIVENSNIEKIKKTYNVNGNFELLSLNKVLLGIRSNKIFNYYLKKIMNNYDIFYVRHLKIAKFLIEHGKSVVFECHEIFYQSNPKLKKAEKFVLENSLALTFSNKTLKQRFNEVFSLPTSQKVIYNGCGFTLPYLQKDFSTIDEIFYIGSFQSWKGVEFLIECVNEMNIKLKLIGDGDNRGKLEILANQNIEFLGYKTHGEIEGILKFSKLTLIPNTPSVFTDFSTPIKLYEYLMSSNIVLSSNIPTIKEVIENGKNGFLFQCGDKQSFKEKLNKILHMKNDDLQTVAKKGYEKAQNFTWDKRGEEIVIFLKRVYADKVTMDLKEKQLRCLSN